MNSKMTGYQAPNIVLSTIDGKPFSLSAEQKQGKNILLVFLRHLGCLPCREHALQLCQRIDEFSNANTRVMVVSFGTLPALNAWMQDTCKSFEVLLDPDRSAYQIYQLDSSKWRVWSLNTLWMYIKLLAAGRKWQPKGGDTSQLGGDFLIDTKGIIRMAYRSHDPADRPSVDSLLTLIHQINHE